MIGKLNVGILKQLRQSRLLKLMVSALKTQWARYRFRQDFREFSRLSSLGCSRFRNDWNDRKPCFDDNTGKSSFDHHYVYHTAWAARVLSETNPARHVDISSVIWFSAVTSAFLPVDFYDYRPAAIKLSNLRSSHADLTRLSFPSNSVPSLSCMHVVEHVGLGRYGDTLDPEGDLKAISELCRVLAPGGNLLLVMPVGRPRIQFNAHRIYSYQQVVQAVGELSLKEFSAILDYPATDGLLRNAPPECVAEQRYACGCFLFRKPASPGSTIGNPT